MEKLDPFIGYYETKEVNWKLKGLLKRGVAFKEVRTARPTQLIDEDNTIYNVDNSISDESQAKTSGGDIPRDVEEASSSKQLQSKFNMLNIVPMNLDPTFFSIFGLSLAR